jgi:hypothetical protein
MWVDKGRKIRMTWRELNDQLRKATKVKPILQLYKAERKGKRRKRWLTGIYCRYSYLRWKKEIKAVASAGGNMRDVSRRDFLVAGSAFLSARG